MIENTQYIETPDEVQEEIIAQCDYFLAKEPFTMTKDGTLVRGVQAKVDKKILARALTRSRNNIFTSTLISDHPKWQSEGEVALNHNFTPDGRNRFAVIVGLAPVEPYETSHFMCMLLVEENKPPVLRSYTGLENILEGIPYEEKVADIQELGEFNLLIETAGSNTPTQYT